jgi:hypothetical protein
MDTKLFYSIIDRIAEECPKAVVVPWMNGEPLLHPDYAEMIEYVSKYGLPYYITTNGMLWKEEVFDHVTSPASSCYQVIFSFDGMPSERSCSIEVARPGSDRNLILSNIRKLIELRNARKSSLTIALKVCRRGQDWEEIEKLISYGLLDLKVDYVCVGDSLDKLNEESMRSYPCQYFDNNFMVIKDDGRVVLCAYNIEATNNPKNAMGYIRDDGAPIMDVYNNVDFCKRRHEQNKGIFEEPCKSCGFPYNGYGLKGKVSFRDKELGLHDVYYSRDYYNQLFSLYERRKPDTYYRRDEEGLALWR